MSVRWTRSASLGFSSRRSSVSRVYRISWCITIAIRCGQLVSVDIEMLGR